MSFKKQVMDVDAYSLAANILGYENHDEIDDYEDQIEQEFFDRFEIEMDKFEDLLEYLLPRIKSGTSPLTEEPIEGFGIIRNEEKQQIELIVKKIWNENGS